MYNCDTNSYLLKRNMIRATGLVVVFFIGICFSGILVAKREKTATVVDSDTQINQLGKNQKVCMKNCVVLFTLDGETATKLSEVGEYSALGVINEADSTISCVIMTNERLPNDALGGKKKIRVGEKFFEAIQVVGPVEGFLSEKTGDEKSKPIHESATYYLLQMGEYEKNIKDGLSPYILKEILVGDNISSRENPYLYAFVLCIVFELISLPVWVSVFNRWRNSRHF